MIYLFYFCFNILIANIDLPLFFFHWEKKSEAGLGQPARVQGSGPWTCSGHSAAWENRAALTFQQSGGAVKALSPKARPFCDRQVVPTEGGLRGSLLHAVPVP